MFTDAAGSIGFGIYFSGRWSQGRWPSWVKDLELSLIAALELFPIYAALMTWGQELSNMKVRFMSDNQATVTIINKQTSSCPLIMKMVRKIVMLCLLLNILFTASYIEGCNNNIADSLSRFQMTVFRKLVPQAHAKGDVYPADIWDVLK